MTPFQQSMSRRCIHAHSEASDCRLANPKAVSIVGSLLEIEAAVAIS